MRSAYAAPIGRVLVTLALSAVSAAAQSTLATLGVVLDEHRGAVLDAAVTVTSLLDTGAVRRATSDRYGRFRVAGVVRGRYELRGWNRRHSHHSFGRRSS